MQTLSLYRVAPPQAHRLHTGTAEIFGAPISEPMTRLKYMNIKAEPAAHHAGSSSMCRAPEQAPGGQSQPHAALYVNRSEAKPGFSTKSAVA
jgi:hypothetical protein